MDLDDEEEDEGVQAPQSSPPAGRQVSRVWSTQQPPQSSIIGDLGDSSDEDDD